MYKQLSNTLVGVILTVLSLLCFCVIASAGVPADVAAARAAQASFQNAYQDSLRQANPLNIDWAGLDQQHQEVTTLYNNSSNQATEAKQHSTTITDSLTTIQSSLSDCNSDANLVILNKGIGMADDIQTLYNSWVNAESEIAYYQSVIAEANDRYHAAEVQLQQCNYVANLTLNEINNSITGTQSFLDVLNQSFDTYITYPDLQTITSDDLKTYKGLYIYNRQFYYNK